MLLGWSRTLPLILGYTLYYTYCLQVIKMMEAPRIRSIAENKGRHMKLEASPATAPATNQQSGFPRVQSFDRYNKVDPDTTMLTS